jgi:hypothetical protein
MTQALYAHMNNKTIKKIKGTEEKKNCSPTFPVSSPLSRYFLTIVSDLYVQ